MATAVDLFCGAGGLTVGLKQAGFAVVGAVEIAPLAVDTYAENHPEVKIFSQDIREIDPKKMRLSLGLKVGELSMLAGCPPCQGFSTLRTMNGKRQIVDDRNDLISDFLGFVEAFLPRIVMMENVPGLSKDVRFFAFQHGLKRLGYDTFSEVRNAAHFGVPQRRRRLILMAGRGFRIPFPERAPNTVTVRDTIWDLPSAGASGDPLHDLGESRSARIRRLISRIPVDGGSRNDLPPNSQLKCHLKCNGFKDVYGRMSWDRVSPTITSGCFNPSKGRFLHPVENRAITLREAAMLQSFPRNYKFPNVHSKSAIALLIGNALPAEFIRQHAALAMSELQKRGFADAGCHASSNGRARISGGTIKSYTAGVCWVGIPAFSGDSHGSAFDDGQAGVCVADAGRMSADHGADC